MKLKSGYVIAIVTALAFGVPGALLAKDSEGHHQSGIASVYSTESGSGTASGQRLNPRALTAAHRSLPFGTKVQVTNKRNGKTIVVTINDRGPFVHGRVIDLTPAAAEAIGMGWGLAPVDLDIVS